MTHTRNLTSTLLTALLLTAPLGAPALAGTAHSACDEVMMQGKIAQLGATHATITTSILIDAPADVVWDTLTDFDAMPSWSTGTLQKISGDVQDAGTVTVTYLFGVDDAGLPISNEIPHTLIYAEGETLGWSDPLPAEFGGGRDNHLYQVRACGDKTLFTQSDEIVENPYAVNFVAQFLAGFQTFNADLKAAAER